jgi:FtsH-binding integral membrane protein
MNTFWKLVEKSTITSGLLALMLAGTACYCVISQTSMPEYFLMALGTVIGFFFTSKIKDESALKATKDLS